MENYEHEYFYPIETIRCCWNLVWNDKGRRKMKNVLLDPASRMPDQQGQWVSYILWVWILSSKHRRDLFLTAPHMENFLVLGKFLALWDLYHTPWTHKHAMPWSARRDGRIGIRIFLPIGLEPEILLKFIQLVWNEKGRFDFQWSKTNPNKFILGSKIKGSLPMHRHDQLRTLPVHQYLSIQWLNSLFIYI